MADGMDKVLPQPQSATGIKVQSDTFQHTPLELAWAFQSDSRLFPHVPVVEQMVVELALGIHL